MNLIQKHNTCKICGNKENNLIYKVKKRQINGGGYFSTYTAVTAEPYHYVMRLRISAIFIMKTIIRFI